MDTLAAPSSELEREKRHSKKKSKSVSSSESKHSDKSKRRTKTKSENDDDRHSSSSRKEREERRVRDERLLAIEYLLAVAEATTIESSLAVRSSVPPTPPASINVNVNRTATGMTKAAGESHQPDTTLHSEPKTSMVDKQESEGEQQTSMAETQASEGVTTMTDAFWFNAPVRSETKSSRRKKQEVEEAMRMQDPSQSGTTRISEPRPSRATKPLSDFDVLQKMLDSQRDLTVATEETGSTSSSRDPQRRSRDVRVYCLDPTERANQRTEEDVENNDDDFDLHLHRSIKASKDFFDGNFDEEMFEAAFDDFNMDSMSLSPWPEVVGDNGCDKFAEMEDDVDFEPVVLSPRQKSEGLTGMNFQVVSRNSTSSAGHANQGRTAALLSTRSARSISSASDTQSRMSDLAL